MLETVGTRLRQARLRRGLEMEEVAEATKIRPERLAELEADDYSHFPSLAYAKSFLAKYAKYLGVDVRDELENFRVSHSISLAEYQYLSSAPPRYVPDPRPLATRAFRVPPLLVAFLVLLLLVGLPVFAYLAVGIARLGPRPGPLPVTQGERVVSATPEPAPPSPEPVVLSSILEGTPPISAAASSPSLTTPDAAILPAQNSAPGMPASRFLPALLPGPVPLAAWAAASAVAMAPRPANPAVMPPTAPLPELPPAVSPAQPNPTPGDSPDAGGSVPLAGGDPGQPAAGPPADPETPDGKRLEVRALRRTYIRVVRDERSSQPVFSGYASPKANPVIVVKGKRFWLKVSDRRAVEVREDGQVVRGHSPNIVIN